KILDLAGQPNVAVAESTVRGLNPFAREARRDSLSVNLFPILNEQEELRTPLVATPGQTWLAETLKAAPEPVTLLVTGPLPTVGVGAGIDPSRGSKIAEI